MAANWTHSQLLFSLDLKPVWTETLSALWLHVKRMDLELVLEIE